MKTFHLLIRTSILFICISTSEARQQSDINYFLQKSGIRKTNFQMNKARNGRLQVTNLDSFRDILLLVRKVLLNEASASWPHLYRYNLDNGKIQKPQNWQDFPCSLNNTKSTITPSSVHELRPGDIDIIAAIGDSLSAGNGVMSETLVDVAVEFRSLAFTGGGSSDWRTVLTLPNILKVFNPNLYGFSTADVLVTNKNSYLNIAEPMIMSRDLVYQAQILIERMRKDSRIDMENHWKLLTIFVGSNDICSDMCHYDSLWDFLYRHERDLKNALTLLRNNIPRLLVNLMPPPNVVTSVLAMKNIPWSCEAFHRIECNCIFSDRYNAQYLQTISEFSIRWQHLDEHIARLQEFQTNDFAVLYQPCTANVTMPTLANGDTDLRYFASDCFHFSQLGHASAANALWNNMLQMPGEKERAFSEPFQHFECPSEERPYFVTFRNSLRQHG